jgi:histidinol-phosphate aminotransferase
MHSIIADGTGTNWITADREAGYALSAHTVVTAIERERPDLVFLCSPNNPTGTPLGIDVIEAAYQATDGIVLVDEAYAEFTDGPSALTLLPGRPRLIVTRTMSKAFAFAGARLGYLAADPAVADALRLVRLPYHLSALTQAAAVAALAHAPEMLAMVEDIKVQRDRLLVELPELGYPVLDSAANFVLFGGVDDPHAAFEALLAQDIIIRDVGIPNHLRVTAGSQAETSAFLEALAGLSEKGARRIEP